jgi:hypothetical protein
MRATWIVLIVMGLALAGCATPRPTPSTVESPRVQSAPTTPPPSPTVVDRAPVIAIAPGLSPRLTPAEVGAQVLDRIHAMEAQVGRVATPPRILTIEARAADGDIHWTVRAEGTFTSNRPRVSPLPVVASGYFVISDADGTVFGFGFP